MKTKKLGRTILLALLLAVLTTGTVFAAEDVTGYITELNSVDGTITIDVDGDLLTPDDVYTVLVGDNFNFDNHLVGDLITVQGTVGEDDVILMTELKIMERVKDQTKLQDGEGDAFYCGTDLTQVHPVVENITERYGEDIMTTFCSDDGDQMGLGKIMLILQTAESTDLSIEDILAGGFEGVTSWGQIWQEADFQGKPDKGTPPGQIQDNQSGEDTEETDTKGKKNNDGEESSECEDGEFLCNVSEWFKSQSKKGNK